MEGQAHAYAFEEAIPTTWDVRTTEASGAASVRATSPNGVWVIELIRNPAHGGYNIDLYDTRGRGMGLYDGINVKRSGEVPEAVKSLIETATGGRYRGARHRAQRTGRTDDRVGLFDELG
jgi:hypothetical protein